jgi:hypothetical protein
VMLGRFRFSRIPGRTVFDDDGERWNPFLRGDGTELASRVDACSNDCRLHDDAGCGIGVGGRKVLLSSQKTDDNTFHG